MPGRRPSPSPTALRSTLLLVVGLLGVFGTVEGQLAGDRAEGGAFRASVVGGADHTYISPHIFGGLSGAYLPMPTWGGEGIVLLGGGDAYRSVFIAAGPTVRAWTSNMLEVRVWGGGGWYRETLDVESAPARSLPAAAGGVNLRVPVGSVALTGGALFWGGSLNEADFERGTTVTGIRFFVGVGR